MITHAYAPDRVGVRYLAGGLKVYYVPYGVIARQDTLPNFFALLPLLRTILIREEIDLVHAHQALSSMAHEGILHAKTLGIKTVFTDHSLFGFADVASILTNKLLRFALCDADHIVCVSHTGYAERAAQLTAGARTRCFARLCSRRMCRQFLMPLCRRTSCQTRKRRPQTRSASSC